MSVLEPAADTCVVLSTVPPDVAERIAHELVASRLAACVNVLPGLRSVYRWEDAIQNDPESLLLAKTSRALLERLRERLVSLHPYEVPEVLVLGPEAIDKPYLAWLRAALSPPPERE